MAAKKARTTTPKPDVLDSACLVQLGQCSTAELKVLELAHPEAMRYLVDALVDAGLCRPRQHFLS